ncbi:MAG: chorismate-binding protein, partial [Verrucomicrobiia bacterium]
APDDLDLPDMIFMACEVALLFDHKARRLRVTVLADTARTSPDSAYRHAKEKLADTLGKLRRPITLAPLSTTVDVKDLCEPRSTYQRARFERMVRDAKEFIRAGDIFQVVLSQRFEAPFSGSPLDLYRALRFVNPSPYLFCLHLPAGRALIGSSPEVHVRVQDGQVDIRPIAGTRPRGTTVAEDDALASDLLSDPKERAEHVMLVDLARNDVGRIAEYSTVKVTDFMTIERYSHVMHIVSNVVGKLHPGRNAFDVMRATFPAGTVSGSPKVRAMQIINQMEITKRGTYAGAVASFRFDGNLDSCITLRSILLQNNMAYVQTGAGIVADSTPEGEYQETVNKARGMLRAIALATGTSSAESS